MHFKVRINLIIRLTFVLLDIEVEFFSLFFNSSIGRSFSTQLRESCEKEKKKRKGKERKKREISSF